MWSWRIVRRLVVIAAIALLPAAAYAQQAVIMGTVTDSTGGVLPGVVVVATHLASGNTFEATTDERGAFRLAVRTGAFKIEAKLEGFAPFTRSGLDLLLAQEVSVNLQMVPANLEQSVTVTGESPLIDTATSTVGTNIDPKQMDSLPLNGRNWMDLTLTAAGSRSNESGGAPLLRGTESMSQINVDGQQVTVNFVGTGNDQPKFSRDVIAEFELLTNRFDATQGRSAGMQVNAVTKSGTNNFAGTLSGYFRDAKLNSEDFIRKVVLPYSNQQVSGTFGGPIVKNRIHFFTNLEYEREPQTMTHNSPYPTFNLDIPAPRRQYSGGARGDAQVSSHSRFSMRYQYYNETYYTGGGATNHPSAMALYRRRTTQLLGTYSQVLGNQALNEVKIGASFAHRINEPVVQWKGGNFPNADTWSLYTGVPLRIQMNGYNVGTALQFHDQNKISFRDDFTLSFSKAGRHNLRTGAEYIDVDIKMRSCASGCSHRLMAQGGAISSLPIPIEQLLPVWNDASTFNYDGFAKIVQGYDRVVSDVKGFQRTIPQKIFGTWLQDDWTIGKHLTLNLGIRYDLQTGVGEKILYAPIYPGNLPIDKNNVAPRVGFAYTLNDKTVVRGGFGRFFVEGNADEIHTTMLLVQGAIPEVLNDGRADFPSNPFNGPDPSVASIRARNCWTNNMAPGCLRTDIIPEHVDRFYQTPYSNQASIGVQRQLGPSMALESNLVWTGTNGDPFQQNMNLSYDPATGVNYPYTNIAARPMQAFGRMQETKFRGWSNYYGIQTSLTRRMAGRWQGSVNYTLSWFKDARAQPQGFSIVNGWLTPYDLGFNVAPDLGGEYTLATTDQRHRAVFNGIFDVGHGFMISGLYFYGSGYRYAVTAGSDRRGRGVTGEDRLRADGTIVPRNSFIGKPLHRVDLRLQERVGLGGKRTIDGIVEVFNLLNHANYGSYVTNEANATYGQPTYNNNTAYQPRGVQLGIRIAF